MEKRDVAEKKSLMQRTAACGEIVVCLGFVLQ